MNRLKPRQVLMVYWTVFAVGAAVLLFAVLKDSEIILYIGIAMIFTAVGFHLLCYNCPHCGKYLGRNSPNGFCPHCGKRIEE